MNQAAGYSGTRAARRTCVGILREYLARAGAGTGHLPTCAAVPPRVTQTRAGSRRQLGRVAEGARGTAGARGRGTNAVGTGSARGCSGVGGTGGAKEPSAARAGAGADGRAARAEAPRVAGAWSTNGTTDSGKLQ
jgi:hypothetical protein